MQPLVVEHRNWVCGSLQSLLLLQCLEEAGTNQVLIFVHSRKETYKTAKFLQEEAMRNDDLAKFVPGSSASREVLQVITFMLT